MCNYWPTWVSNSFKPVKENSFKDETFANDLSTQILGTIWWLGSKNHKSFFDWVIIICQLHEELSRWAHCLCVRWWVGMVCVQYRIDHVVAIGLQQKISSSSLNTVMGHHSGSRPCLESNMLFLSVTTICLPLCYKLWSVTAVVESWVIDLLVL